MTDALKLLIEYCSAHMPNNCENCVFNSFSDNYSGIDLDCDSGCYNKKEWDYKEIKQLLSNKDNKWYNIFKEWVIEMAEIRDNWRRK